MCAKLLGILMPVDAKLSAFRASNNILHFQVSSPLHQMPSTLVALCQIPSVGRGIIFCTSVKIRMPSKRIEYILLECLVLSVS